MKTITIQAYSFDELNEQAQEKAINWYRDNRISTDHIYDEASNTVRKFHELFGTKEGSMSWLDVRTGHIDDNVMNLKGIRLRTYIINNFGNQLFKGKYYSLWSKKEKSFEHYPNGYPVLKSRHSKVIFENNAVLTGWYYDDMILQPVYQFLDWKLRPDYNTYMDFETLMTDCFKELEKAIEEEIEATTSDENIIEEIKDRDIQFTIEGKFIE